MAIIQYGKRSDGVYAALEGVEFSASKEPIVYLFVTDQGEDWAREGHKWGHATLTIEEASRLVDALHEMVAKAETLKPKPKSFNEETAHLGVGAVIVFKGNPGDLWIKTAAGWRGLRPDGITWKPSGLDDGTGPGWHLSEFTIISEGVK